MNRLTGFYNRNRGEKNGEYRIDDIQYIDTQQTRIDGKYPEWIGSLVVLDPDTIEVGRGVRAAFTDGKYFLDNTLYTSQVEGCVQTEDGVVFQTLNSIYVLEKIENESY